MLSAWHAWGRPGSCNTRIWQATNWEAHLQHAAEPESDKVLAQPQTRKHGQQQPQQQAGQQQQQGFPPASLCAPVHLKHKFSQSLKYPMTICAPSLHFKSGTI